MSRSLDTRPPAPRSSRAIRRTGWRLGSAAALAILVATSVACGGDDDREAVDQTATDATGPATTADPADTGPDADGTTDTEEADGLTIARWCDPLDEAVDQWLDSTPRAEHSDLFATDAENPALVCSWSGEQGGELRVVVEGSTQVWEHELEMAGGETAGIEGLDADHVYEPGRLTVALPDGGALAIYGFEGGADGEPVERVDDPEGLAAIAAVALAATSG